MTIKFETISGSLYEVDQENCRVRRLVGVKDPTPRQGADGDWREYADITDIAPGLAVMITWRFDVEPEAVWARSTLTSNVKEIHSEEDENN